MAKSTPHTTVTREAADVHTKVTWLHALRQLTASATERGGCGGGAGGAGGGGGGGGAGTQTSGFAAGHANMCLVVTRCDSGRQS